MPFIRFISKYLIIRYFIHMFLVYKSVQFIIGSFNKYLVKFTHLYFAHYEWKATFFFDHCNYF